MAPLGGRDLPARLPVKVWLFASLFVVAFAVQTSLLAPLSVWGVRPDLALVLVCVFALSRGPLEGAAAGLMAGLFVDLVGGRMIGLGAFTKAAAGATVGWLGQTIFRDNALVSVVMVVVASAVEELLYLLGTWAFGFGVPILRSLIHVVLPSIGYDALTAALLYPILTGFLRRMERRSSGRRGPVQS